MGRSRELSSFSGFLSDKRGSSFVICGPAGVGKSRLAEKCWEQALGLGFRGGRAVATAEAATVPLGAIAHLLPSDTDLSDPIAAFASVANALADPKRRTSVLLIDDLHLLDAASAMLIRQLMDAGTVRLIATLRSGERLSSTVSALIHGDAVHRVDLAELSEEQAKDLLGQVLGRPCGLRSVRALHQASGGNVLYLHELVRGALDAGSLVISGEVWELAAGALTGTPRLAELVGARLAAAGPDGRPLLELLALCGSISLTDAESCVHSRFLSELERTGLLVTRLDGRRTSLSLAHPLYGEVLRANISALRRRVLLLGQIARLENYGARRLEDTLHIASWRLAATGTADAGLLMKAAVLSIHAHDYGQVVSLLEALPEERHCVQTRLLKAAALTELGLCEDAENSLVQASEQVSDDFERISVAISRAMNMFWGRARTPEALQVLDEAADQVDPESQKILEIAKGSLLVASGSLPRGADMLEGLAFKADHSPHTHAWLVGAMMKPTALAMRGRTGDAISWGMHAHSCHEKLSEQAVLIPHQAMQLNSLILALSESGQLNEARDLGTTAFSDLISAQAQAPAVWSALLLGRVEWLAGHPLAARRWYAESVALARAIPHLPAIRPALVGMAASAALLGDVQEARALLDESQRFPKTSLFSGEERLAEAWILAVTGHLTQARNALAEAAEDARRGGNLTSEILLLTDISRLGGAKSVSERLTRLSTRCDGEFALARANLATALANDDPDGLLLSADKFHLVGADLLEAEAAAAAATSWRRGGETRRATAAANRAAAATVRCEGARTPALVTAEVPSSLTAREQEIALLAASGMPSKEIAASLTLSVRTVNNHLHHIYSKLGVTNRRELRWAIHKPSADAAALE
ncbi:LuxR C-terminal-related transcriptional regulator [Streptomyces sp. NPDC085614]|uniref:helix-turn-helix transcriptional regulator n=1 Tax=Streptomyces sp. NPDC085614 TaxID=3365733 RepID=UPI0037D9491A